jgi:hypothetical protein
MEGRRRLVKERPIGLLRSRHDHDEWKDIRTTKSVSKIAMEELSNVD